MRYIIGEVLDNKTQERSKKWGYRVGRKCHIQEGCTEGTPLIVVYDDGSYFTTTMITSIEENDYGIWITTLNTTYRFDRLKTKIITNKIRCKSCNDIIESEHTHDFKWCSCGSVAVDGGKSYLKRGYKGSNYKDCFEELSDIEEVAVL